MGKEEKQVKCNQCGYVGPEDEFPHGRDFFQSRYVSGCPAEDCDNTQTPGDASMRMMPGTEPPFSFVRPDVDDEATPLERTLHKANEAS